MEKCKQCGQKDGVHKMSCESRKVSCNLERIEYVLKFYIERGINSEIANNIKRKIIDK